MAAVLDRATTPFILARDRQKILSLSKRNEEALLPTLKTLRELREHGEQHLKKADELLGTADLLRSLTADAANVEVLSPAFAEEAEAAAKELYDNYEQSKAFLDEVVRRLNTTDQATIQTMNDRFDQLLKQRVAAMDRYHSLLEKYEASERGGGSATGD